MPSVLIVSPRFPPTNAPDMHRIRVSLGHYAHCGWEPTVLCIDPETADGVDDPLLEQSLPAGLRVIKVRAWLEKTCRKFGFGEFSYRSLVPLHRAGRKLLADKHHEVVFFSTTAFLVFVLGPLWKRRFGCRVVYDFQDPWYSEQLGFTPQTVPGRWWKYRLDRCIARILERFAVGAADHIIAVSPGYAEALARRYPWLDRTKFTVLPFGGAPDDYDVLDRSGVSDSIIRSDASASRWVSVGRAGPDMNSVLTVLFEVLAQAGIAAGDLPNRIRLHFVGTNYAPPDRTQKLVEPLAAAAGLARVVEESPLRIPYFEALAIYAASDAILLIGSIEPDYAASKLLTCLLSGKPILALFHRDSPVSKIAADFPNVFLATFSRSPEESRFRARLAEGVAWLQNPPSFDRSAIAAAARPWLPRELTQRQCAIFDQVVANASSVASPVAATRSAIPEA